MSARRGEVVIRWVFLVVAAGSCGGAASSAEASSPSRAEASADDWCKEAQALVELRQFAGALGHYRKCLRSEGLTWRLIEEIVSLAALHEPTYELIEEERQRLTSLVSSGRSTPEDVQDLVHLNEASGSGEATIELFRKLAGGPGRSETREQLWFWIFDAVYRQRGFLEMVRQMDVALRRLRSEEAKVSVAAYRRRPRHPLPKVIHLGVLHYRAALHMAEVEVAAELAGAVVELYPSPESFALLLREADAERAVDARERLMSAARERLADEELDELRRLVGSSSDLDE